MKFTERARLKIWATTQPKGSLGSSLKAALLYYRSTVGSLSKLRLLAHVIEIRLSHHETDTVRGTAVTGIIPIVLQAETIVEGELLPCPDIPKGNQPDMILIEQRFTVGRTAVI